MVKTGSLFFGNGVGRAAAMIHSRGFFLPERPICGTIRVKIEEPGIPTRSELSQRPPRRHPVAGSFAFLLRVNFITTSPC